MTDIAGTRVLVAGAGGVLGREVVKSLNRRGIVPDGLAYSQREFELVDGKLGRKLCCDVTKPECLDGICHDVDIVISVIGITRLGADITHMDVDYKGNMNLLHKAQKAGVRRFAFISPAGTDKGHKEVPLFEAKYLFEEELRRSGIEWVIFRSGGFFRDFADYGKAGAKGTSWVINGGLNRSTPIAIGDLAEIMVDDTLKDANKIIDVGGPEDLTWRDICRICAETLDARTRIVSLPTWLCNLALWMLRPFSHKYYAMGRLLVYTSTHDLLSSKRGKTRFSDYVREYYGCNFQR